MIIALRQNKNLKWYIALPILILTGFFTIASLYEFVNVGLLNNSEGYIWGTEGPLPWYYESPQRYAQQMLLHSIISCGVFITTLVLIIKRKIIGLLFVSLLSLTLLTIHLLSNGID